MINKIVKAVFTITVIGTFILVILTMVERSGGFSSLPLEVNPNVTINNPVPQPNNTGDDTAIVELAKQLGEVTKREQDQNADLMYQLSRPRYDEPNLYLLGAGLVGITILVLVIVLVYNIGQWRGKRAQITIAERTPRQLEKPDDAIEGQILQLPTNRRKELRGKQR